MVSGIAWLIIPQKWTINVWTGVVKISSWRVFLAICSLPEFLACLAIFAFPESPRFLLLKGRREEALEVFRKIYSVNTGKDPDSYPVSNVRYFSALHEKLQIASNYTCHISTHAHSLHNINATIRSFIIDTKSNSKLSK